MKDLNLNNILKNNTNNYGCLNECLETILNKAQEPPKSKKVLSETY